MTDYVCGFMFSRERDTVALIEKQKPEWQRGKLNGIGGKIELHETAADAMAREFREETGVVTQPGDWGHFCRLEGTGWCVHFYRAFSEKVFNVRTMETEKVFLYNPAVMSLGLSHLVLPNLKVLIPLALDQSGIEVPVLLRDSVPQD